MESFLLIISYIGGTYAIIKIVHDMFINKKLKDILISHEFVILCISILLVFIFSFNWSEIHIGKQSVKIVYRDTSSNHTANTTVKVKETPEFYLHSKKKHKTTSRKNFLKPDLAIKSKIDSSKKATTTTTSPPLNGVISTGANAHIVAGSNNSVGVNGNVYLTSDRHLSDTFLNEIFNAVEQFRIKKAIKKRIQVVVESYSNAQLTGAQLMQFFSDRGYFLETGMLFKDKSIKENIFHNLQVEPFGQEFIIIRVGVFD